MLTRPQRWLLVGGFLVVLLGLVYGLVYTFLVDHQTLPRLREPYRALFVAAAEKDVGGLESALAAAQAQNYEYVRAIDVHTHLIKMASLAIMIGLIFSVVQWDERQRYALAVLFLSSAVIFPLGVFAEIFSRSLIPQVVAAGGALLAIVSLGLILVGLNRGLRPNA